MDYTSFVASLANMMGQQDVTFPDFQTMVPDAIAYAEGRCYRDLDMLAAIVRDATQALSSGSRNLTLPSTTVTVIEGFNLVTPAGTTNPDGGTRVPLTVVSRDYLDMAWPSFSQVGQPSVIAMINDTTAIVGPVPDGAYTVEVIGTGTPAPLSADNTTTPLTTYLPDLFLSAAMIFASAFQKNFGAQGDDPQMAQSWEAQYGKELASAAAWEFRKKFMAEGWTSMQPNPVAKPPRV